MTPSPSSTVEASPAELTPRQRELAEALAELLVRDYLAYPSPASSTTDHRPTVSAECADEGSEAAFRV